MEYKLYCLEFLTGVHFGSKNLDSTEITFHADTLFAALFQEALKMEKQKEFLNAVSEGSIVLSDAFPYIGKNYYIPKPMISVRVDDNEKQGNSRQKKMFKNLKYIPVNTVEAFINGTFPEEHMEDMQYLGKQSALYDTEFAATLAMKILCAKIKNQSVVLRRYEKSRGIDLEEEQKMLTICKNKIMTCNRIEEMIGFEGQAAKYYFKGLAACIDKEFSFQGRSRRPPRDEFNSMISLGYSILMNEVYCKIEMKGLNPYFGFIHRDAEKHPTLASDMMEEWRAVIVDATAMSMINGHEIQKEHFNFSMDEPGCYLTREGLKIYLNKLERKFQTEVRYLKYVDYAVSFRRGIFLQMEHLAKAIEEGNANLYEPITIR